MARTTALTKIEQTLYEPTFYKVIQGGQGAGKTYAIMTILVGYCESYPDAKVTVVGVSYNHLKDGAISDFKNIMKETNRWDDTKWNKSELFFAFKNGSELQFRSFDKISGRGPRRDVVYVNEADALTYETFGNIANRSKDFAIIDFNPVAKFWAHEELVEKQSKRTSFLILNFEDNEALPPQERDNIESHRPLPGEEPSNWWLVYGLGQIGSLEGNIYHGWEMVDRAEIEQTGRLIRYGLDFGFSNDETALVAVYEMPDGKTGLVELIYEKGLLGSQYAGALEEAGVDPNVLIVADSARPEIIAEIKAAGYRIIGADKAPGSVLRGIDYVSQRQIVYAGENLRREYLSYAWRKKRSGEVLDEPQDGNDHCLPASQKVKTLKGDIPIGDLVGKKGWIWAEHGKLRYFRNVRKTGEEVVYEFTLDDGSSFRCSGEHPIYTINRGPVPARLLTKKDKVQLYNYARKDYQQKQTRVQRITLLARQKFGLLSQRLAQAPLFAQDCVGVSQRASAEGTGYRPHRPEQGQQPNRELTSSDSISQQQECVGRSQEGTQNELRQDTSTNEGMACLGGGASLALRAWQACLSKEKADRKNMCALWEKILYNTILKDGSVLLAKLQNAGKEKAPTGPSREYASITFRKTLGKEPVYCLDVYDTSNFALANGVVVSNCMDAIRYAISDLHRPTVSYGGIR